MRNSLAPNHLGAALLLVTVAALAGASEPTTDANPEHRFGKDPVRRRR